MRKQLAVLSLSPLLVAALAACGSNNNSGSASQSNHKTSGVSSATHAVLSVRSTKLGKVLVNKSGDTVYLFTADSKNHSTCNPSCLGYWPAVKATGKVPSSLPGINATIGTTSDMSGAKIVTANGWPLYTYVKDAKPGDVTGEETNLFGGKWYVVSPSGNKVEPKGGDESSSSGGGGGSNNGGGGGGYGY
jgi:predicted lipoprotein with Yx(FWY)xxD motif